MVRLEPMSAAAFAAYLETAVSDYAREKVKSGNWREAESLNLARQTYANLLPDGLATPDQHFFTIRAPGEPEPVGMLWYAVVADESGRHAWVYDVVIYPQFRRRGYATQAFRALEADVQQRGLDVIRLHVFGSNVSARALYRRLGYGETNVIMAKTLESTPAAVPGKPRVVVFISGSGTNLQALIDAAQGGELDAEIVLVVSNRQAAYGLERARRAGIPTLHFPLKPYREAGKQREAYDADLAAHVAAAKPDLVVLAGWMHVLSQAFLDRFTQRVINLHPALPGMFPGTHAIERAFEAFQRGEIAESGCMVHVAVPEVDAGPVVAQMAVPMYSGDTLTDFEARMHATEHVLIVEAVRRALGQSRS